jgi:hypothetical protein
VFREVRRSPSVSRKCECTSRLRLEQKLHQRIPALRKCHQYKLFFFGRQCLLCLRHGFRAGRLHIGSMCPDVKIYSECNSATERRAISSNARPSCEKKGKPSSFIFMAAPIVGEWQTSRITIRATRRSVRDCTLRHAECLARDALLLNQ